MRCLHDAQIGAERGSTIVGSEGDFHQTADDVELRNDAGQIVERFDVAANLLQQIRNDCGADEVDLVDVLFDANVEIFQRLVGEKDAAAAAMKL